MLKILQKFQFKKKTSKTKTLGDPKPTSSGISSRAKAWFQQLARGIMLPIAILPIAGLLLGIGGAIGANTKDAGWLVVSEVFKSMSDVVFGNLALLFCVAVAITFSNDKGGAGFAAVIAYLVFTSSQRAFIQIDEHGNILSILWFHPWVNGVTVSNLGMTSLNTSIFGGVIIGVLTAYTFKYFSQIQLPTALSFFSGIRLVPIVLVPFSFLVSVVFLIFWPWVGQGIQASGVLLQKAPAGIDGFIYGVLGRALMPFGLHHIPIILAFQTDFGGVLSVDTLNAALANGSISQMQHDMLIQQIDAFTKGKTVIVGDQNIWNFINSLPTNTMSYIGKDVPIYDWFKTVLGINAGRFTQDYATYLGTCMGIGAAMIMTADKANRKVTAATIGSSMVVAFLTGITEPLEFSFLFVAPLFYYLIYVPLSGFAYMFMILVDAHVGVGFARGFIDLMIYGALPILKGTKFYFGLLFALIFGGVSFATFYFWIKKANLSTPGRNGNTLGLINKKQYQELKEGKTTQTSKKVATKGNQQDEIHKIIAKLGGKANLASVSACATRLRITLKKYQKLDNKDFVEFGSFGLIQDKTSVQIIFGGKAAILADKINTVLNND
ncbi:MAG: PTS transporter subunit EIIC [Mycoplasma sp.]